MLKLPLFEKPPAGSSLLVIVFSLGTFLLTSYLIRSFYRHKLDIPQIGESPSFLGNTSKGHFHSHSEELINEGYTKYQNSLYKIWTTDMDRVVVSHKFADDFNKLPRSAVQLTANIRHAGKYTGMSMAEEGHLHHDVCTGQLNQNLSRLPQPVYDEFLFALNQMLSQVSATEGNGTFTIWSLVLDLITRSTSRVFVGPSLCRNPEWLQTATGYTTDINAVSDDLKAYHKIFYPIIAPFLSSYRQLQARFISAKMLLLPLLQERSHVKGKEGNKVDMLQWLVETARGEDAKPDRLVKRALLLNKLSIHPTAITAVNVLLNLCARPECVELLRQEMREALDAAGGIKLSALNALKKTDSFIKETQRLDTPSLTTFNRQLLKPLTLSNGVTLPAFTYVTMAHWPLMRDPKYYPSPLSFEPLRFYNLRQQPGQSEKHTFASYDANWPQWAFGKFACPGRFWASAQIKLLLMALLLNFDVSYAEGQTERVENVRIGERNMPPVKQKIVLRRRKDIT